MQGLKLILPPAVLAATLAGCLALDEGTGALRVCVDGVPDEAESVRVEALSPAGTQQERTSSPAEAGPTCVELGSVVPGTWRVAAEARSGGRRRVLHL